MGVLRLFICKFVNFIFYGRNGLDNFLCIKIGNINFSKPYKCYEKFKIIRICY